MSVPATPRTGLRERKRLKLRRTVQAEALRLFEAQGYEQTTVEQIADAAETSTTTFYRYFPTKEDVVLDDDLDSLMETVAADRPAGEPLSDTVGAIMDAVLKAVEDDLDQSLARLRLVYAVPALDARYAAEERRTIDLFTRVITERSSLPSDDLRLAVTAAAVVAALFTATRRWANGQGAEPLDGLIGQALATISPLLTDL